MISWILKEVSDIIARQWQIQLRYFMIKQSLTELIQNYRQTFNDPKRQKYFRMETNPILRKTLQQRIEGAKGYSKYKFDQKKVLWTRSDNQQHSTKNQDNARNLHLTQRSANSAKEKALTHSTMADKENIQATQVEFLMNISSDYEQELVKTVRNIKNEQIENLRLKEENESLRCQLFESRNVEIQLQELKVYCRKLEQESASKGQATNSLRQEVKKLQSQLLQSQNQILEWIARAESFEKDNKFLFDENKNLETEKEGLSKERQTFKKKLEELNEQVFGLNGQSVSQQKKVNRLLLENEKLYNELEMLHLQRAELQSDLQEFAEKFTLSQRALQQTLRQQQIDERQRTYHYKEKEQTTDPKLRNQQQSESNQKKNTKKSWFDEKLEYQYRISELSSKLNDTLQVNSSHFSLLSSNQSAEKGAKGKQQSLSSAAISKITEDRAFQRENHLKSVEEKLFLIQKQLQEQKLKNQKLEQRLWSSKKKERYEMDSEEKLKVEKDCNQRVTLELRNNEKLTQKIQLLERELVEMKNTHIILQNQNREMLKHQQIMVDRMKKQSEIQQAEIVCLKTKIKEQQESLRQKDQSINSIVVEKQKVEQEWKIYSEDRQKVDQFKSKIDNLEKELSETIIEMTLLQQENQKLNNKLALLARRSQSQILISPTKSFQSLP